MLFPRLSLHPQEEIRRSLHRGILYLYLFADGSLSIQINTETLYISCPPMPNLDSSTVERFAYVLLNALHDTEKLLLERFKCPGLPGRATHPASLGDAKDQKL